MSRLYGVSKTTLYHRINGRRDQASYGVTKQRLSPEEEESIENWVPEIQSWGFPPVVAQLREMAEELSQARGDYKELEITLTSGFLTSLYVTIKIKSCTRSRTIFSTGSGYNTSSSVKPHGMKYQ